MFKQPSKSFSNFEIDAMKLSLLKLVMIENIEVEGICKTAVGWQGFTSFQKKPNSNSIRILILIK